MKTLESRLTLLAFAALATVGCITAHAAEVYVAATDFSSFVDADGNAATLADGDSIVLAERDGVDIWHLLPGDSVVGHKLIVKNSCGIDTNLQSSVEFRDYKTLYFRGSSIASGVSVSGYGTFYLDKSVTLEGNLYLDGGPMTLNLHGHTLTRTKDRTSAIEVRKDTQLTITGNGRVTCASTDSWDATDVYINSGSASCTIESGTFDGDIFLNWGACTIQGGTFNGQLKEANGNHFTMAFKGEVGPSADWTAYYKDDTVKDSKVTSGKKTDLLLFNAEALESWGGESTMYLSTKTVVTNAWNMHFVVSAKDFKDGDKECRFAIAFQNNTNSGKKSTGNQWGEKLCYIDTATGFLFDSTQYNHYLAPFTNQVKLADAIVENDLFLMGNFTNHAITVDIAFDGEKVTATYTSGSMTQTVESEALGAYLKEAFANGGAYITFLAFAKNLGLEIDDFAFNHASTAVPGYAGTLSLTGDTFDLVADGVTNGNVSAALNVNGTVTLTATEGATYTFTGNSWTFDCTGDTLSTITFPAQAVLPNAVTVALTLPETGYKVIPTGWTTVADCSASSVKPSSVQLADGTSDRLRVRIKDGYVQVRQTPGLTIVVR